MKKQVGSDALTLKEKLIDNLFVIFVWFLDNVWSIAIVTVAIGLLATVGSCELAKDKVLKEKMDECLAEKKDKYYCTSYVADYSLINYGK